ncbi:CgeB family protein [Psychrobacter celer]|uniref:CgeB family protein n=1 Tax=Psychrobacter celer TaxID=306572 RepID=UPI003FD29448
MNKLKIFFQKKESGSVKVEEEHGSYENKINKLKKHVHLIEEENKQLKINQEILLSENKTISYQLGKAIIDSLNKKSIDKKLPAKLLDIYVESRKRRYLHLEDAPLLDKLVIFFKDNSLTEGHRLKDIKEISWNNVSGGSVPSKETVLIDDNVYPNDSLLQPQQPQQPQHVSFGSFKNEDTVELPQKDPIWHEVPVQAGQVLVVKAASQYQNTKNITNRKAILLIKSYDLNGNEILEPCGKMSYSEQLDSHFKYLPCTNNNIQELHTFIVPKGVSQIRIGLCSFTTENDEQVFVSDFSIEPQLDKPQLKSKLSFGLFKHEEVMALPQKDPIWHEVPVQAGQVLVVKAASQYQNTKNITNRKAILLIKSYDLNGNEILEPCGKMSHSSHLNAYFKYLPCTNNSIQELHNFIVPKGVSQIKIGLCGFTIENDEQVFVKNFSIEPKIDQSQVTKFITPSVQAAEISIIGWPEYPVNDKPYIIGIMDEFTTGSFEKDVNLIQSRPDNWFALAEKYKPVLFFIESAWKGNYGSWQYRVGQYANKPGYEIEHICQYARDKGIPTLFWNKEDPVHHDKFMCSAKLVDHIYTTDANMKASYTAKTGNTNVHSLPFAAQPALHKPAPLLGRKSRSCFAGSWYGNRHAERGEAMSWLLQAANNYGLDIYDRNYGTGIFPFPAEYQAGIKGSLPYKELCREYNRYRVFLNVNSVTESPTMFSRRVFELMACGTPVVSTYAKGIEALFDSDAVWLVHSKEEADAAIHTLMTDDVEWRRRSLAGIREIFSKHTYAHRLNSIFADMSIDRRIATNPNVMLVAKANTQAELDMLTQFAHTQSYRDFSLVIESAYGKPLMSDTLPENIVLLEPGQIKAWADKNQNNYSIAGWLTPNSYYGEHYLRDLVNASIYEPEAKGWAKALDEDVFDYNAPAILGGALWQTNEFLNNHMDAIADAHIMDSELYLADSDQFEHLGLERQQTWRV